jgi:hypothetical protein
MSDIVQEMRAYGEAKHGPKWTTGLAEEMGISAPAMRNFANGHRVPSENVIARFRAIQAGQAIDKNKSVRAPQVVKPASIPPAAVVAAPTVVPAVKTETAIQAAPQAPWKPIAVRKEEAIRADAAVRKEALATVEPAPAEPVRSRAAALEAFEREQAAKRAQPESVVIAALPPVVHAPGSRLNLWEAADAADAAERVLAWLRAGHVVTLDEIAFMAPTFLSAEEIVEYVGAGTNPAETLNRKPNGDIIVLSLS